MKICTKCNSEKEDSEFNWKNKSKGIRQWVCRACHSIYLKTHYQRNPKTYLNSTKKIRQKIFDYVRETKDVPCQDCGIKYPYYVMDFDHRDANDKKFLISKSHSTGSLKKVKAEIAKCDVVCANCHRERTYGRVTIMDHGTVF